MEQMDEFDKEMICASWRCADNTVNGCAGKIESSGLWDYCAWCIHYTE